MRSTETSTGRLKAMIRMPLLSRTSVSVSSAKRNTNRAWPPLVLVLTSALTPAARAATGNSNESTRSSNTWRTANTATIRIPRRGGTWAVSFARIVLKVSVLPAI